MKTALGVLPSEINRLQMQIMLFFKEWASTHQTPIPRKEIIKEMELQGVKGFTTVNALNSLLRKGFIRTAYSEKANKTYYVMIRNV